MRPRAYRHSSGAATGSGHALLESRRRLLPLMCLAIGLSMLHLPAWAGRDESAAPDRGSGGLSPAVFVRDERGGRAGRTSAWARPVSQAESRRGNHPVGKRFRGNASWYGRKFHGQRTASGRVFDMNKLTCAHRTLPFSSKVLVENPRNGRSIVVEVTDRGPFHRNRVIDLTREAARRLGILLGGVAYVECMVVDPDTPTG